MRSDFIRSDVAFSKFRCLLWHSTYWLQWLKAKTDCAHESRKEQDFALIGINGCTEVTHNNFTDNEEQQKKKKKSWFFLRGCYSNNKDREEKKSQIIFESILIVPMYYTEWNGSVNDSRIGEGYLDYDKEVNTNYMIRYIKWISTGGPFPLWSMRKVDIYYFPLGHPFVIVSLILFWIIIGLLLVNKERKADWKGLPRMWNIRNIVNPWPFFASFE